MWSRNGDVIPGQTGSTLTISNVRTADIGVYSVTPSNSRGSTNSTSTTLSVSVPININESTPQTITNFVPSVSSPYVVMPNNPRINVTSSGDLIISGLSPDDTGIYTISSPDHGGATITITVALNGKYIVHNYM